MDPVIYKNMSIIKDDYDMANFVIAQTLYRTYGDEPFNIKHIIQYSECLFDIEISENRAVDIEKYWDYLIKEDLKEI